MEGSITRDSVVENPEHSGDNGERNRIILHVRPPATEGVADVSKRVSYHITGFYSHPEPNRRIAGGACVSPLPRTYF
jgi:hypothetical protein